MSAAVLSNPLSTYSPHRDNRRNRRAVRLARTLLVLSLSIIIGSGYAMSAGAGSDQSPAAKYVTVVVAPGETIWSIASQAGQVGGDIQATVNEIIAINGLKNGDLEAGAQIRVPINS